MKHFRSLVLVCLSSHAAALTTFRSLPNGNSSLHDDSLALAGQSSLSAAPHAGQMECGRTLMPRSDLSKRFELYPGASVILDIGGNIGEDLVKYAQRFPHATIFTFEPVPQYYDMLKTKFAGNARVRIFNYGLADADGEAVFTVAGNHGWSSTNQSINGTLVGQKVNVRLREVGAVVAEIRNSMGRNPDVLSINCEGCEYNVLPRMNALGLLGPLQYVQLSWHAPRQIQNRVAERCKVEAALKKDHNLAYWGLYGWQGWRHV